MQLLDCESFLKKNHSTGELERKKGTGPKRKTTAREDSKIIRMSTANRFKTAVDIRAEFNADTGKEIGVHTIRNRLREKGYMARSPAKKHFLRSK